MTDPTLSRFDKIAAVAALASGQQKQAGSFGFLYRIEGWIKRVHGRDGIDTFYTWLAGIAICLTVFFMVKIWRKIN